MAIIFILIFFRFHKIKINYDLINRLIMFTDKL